MRVLIVKTSALGDVVHALPVLAWLKSADPHMEIDWLIEEGFAPLLEGHSLLRRIHRIATRSWRQQGWLHAVRGTLATIGRLRREHYDVAIDLQGNSKSGLFTAFSGAALRYGFAREALREWPNLLATNRRVSLTAMEHHISDRALAVVRAAFPGGSQQLSSGPLPIAPAAARTIADQLERAGLHTGKFAVLHYGTTWTTKLWPATNWQALMKRLAAETNLTMVMTWGNNEERAVIEPLAAASGERAIAWPRGTLPELAALLARAAVVVGGDTGPVHIAAAVGTPTVSFYRVTDATRNGPRGEKHICLQAPIDCSPCLRKSCERDLECGASLEVDQVFDALQRVVKQPVPVSTERAS